MLLLFLLLSSILAILAAGQMTKPIRKLQQGAEVISSGNYNFRLSIDTNDEIEDLSRQFNLMAEKLAKHEMEIKMHRNHLEELVARRTKELIEEKMKLQNILDNVPSAFLLIDRNFKIISASSAVKSLTGYSSPDEVIGKYCYECFSKFNLCSDCKIKEVIKSERSSISIQKVKIDDNPERYFEISFIPIFKNGKINMILEVITDITERKRTEEKLIRSEKLAFVGEMAAVIAHEIRNSITSIKMILQLYLESGNLTEENKESLGVAMDSISKIENTVNQLLQFSRPSPLKFEPVNINALLDISIEFSRIQFRKKRIDVKKFYDKNLPQIYGDVNSLKEAFVNIIINASQSIQKEGTIRITTGREILSSPLSNHPAYEETGLEPGTEVVHIEISDTGCGIPQGVIDKIFEPFFTTKTEGTGLGLSIVRRVVNNHNGIIRVESKTGSGSTFHIYLPTNFKGRNG
jgi:PAS domain S-box-containing protein